MSTELNSQVCRKRDVQGLKHLKLVVLLKQQLGNSGEYLLVYQIKVSRQVILAAMHIS